jgi:hypothetical protein
MSITTNASAAANAASLADSSHVKTTKALTATPLGVPPIKIAGHEIPGDSIDSMKQSLIALMAKIKAHHH